VGRLKRIRNFYIPWLKSEKSNAKKLAWDSRYNQLIRFQVLIDNIELSGKSILDVGCGLGDLCSYILEQGIDVDYTGVDILAEMIADAQKNCPVGNFICADIFKDKKVFGTKRFDVVFASGTFNLKLGNNEIFIAEMVKRFSEFSREYFAFNMLHERSSDFMDTYFYTNPEKISRIIAPYANRIKIIDDYLKNDFTVVCQK